MSENTTGTGGRRAMLTRGWMEIDLDALVRNARTLRDRARVPLIPMIKADAYGLGATAVARALEPLEPHAYGVATVAEGEELRDAGIARQIIVFTPLLEAEFARAHKAGLTPTLGSVRTIEAWSKYDSPYELSIDTGMARAGIPWREVEVLVPVVSKHPPAGAFTHFHSAGLNDGSMQEQEARFEHAISLLPHRPAVLHTDSSAAIARHDASGLEAVRPGIFMYGVGSGSGAMIEPECVVHVRAPVVEIRRIEPGDSVSYDATWRATSPRTIATLALGYGDGYPRNAGEGGAGILRGQVVPITGRVTMDMIMVDVTDSGAETGDTVTLIGDGSRFHAPIDVASVAELAGMSPYEVLTGLRGRLERVYRAGDA